MKSARSKSTQMTSAQVDSCTAAALDCDISAVSFEGLTVKTNNGEPAMLAIIDKNGNVVAAGPSVAEQAWNVAIASYRNFLQGAGYMRVHSKPPGERSA